MSSAIVLLTCLPHARSWAVDRKSAEPTSDEATQAEIAVNAPDDADEGPSFGSPLLTPAAEPSRLQAAPVAEPRPEPAPVARAKKMPARTARRAEPEATPANPAGDDASGSDASGSAEAPAADGKPQIIEAFKKTKTAKTEAEFSQVIDLCRSGMQGGVSKETALYARQLMAWAYNRRGEVRAASGQDQTSLEDFEAAVDLDSNSWRAVHNRGVSYATLGKFKEAMTDFDYVIRLKPNYANAYFNRAELRYESADYPGAIQDYTLAIRFNPKDPASFNSRGHAYYRIDRYREALQDYSEAVRLQPDNAAAYTNRGDAYADLGYFGEAASDYRAAIRLNSKLGRAYQSAAWLMATCPNQEFRNEKLALEAAQKAIALDGDGDYRYLETLAAAQAASGDFRAAQVTQAKVIKLAPNKDAGRYRDRLERYKRNQPYREAPRTVQFNGRRPAEQQTAQYEEPSGQPRGKQYPNARSVPARGQSAQPNDPRRAAARMGSLRPKTSGGPGLTDNTAADEPPMGYGRMGSQPTKSTQRSPRF